MVKTCPECSVEFKTYKTPQVCCSKSCSTTKRHRETPDKIGFPPQKRLEDNPSWKGDKVTYRSVHSWVARNWGRPRVCEHCGTTKAAMYDWSSKEGKTSRDRKDWQRLCRSCHQKYDYANGMRKARGAA